MKPQEPTRRPRRGMPFQHRDSTRAASLGLTMAASMVACTLVGAAAGAKLHHLRVGAMLGAEIGWVAGLAEGWRLLARMNRDDADREKRRHDLKPPPAA